VPERANQNNVLDARCFKVYSDTAGAKTVTLEIQVRTSFLADNGGKVNKGNTWMTVSYVDDTTGAVKVLSTRNPVSNDNLDASTAAWSATTWGAIALTKKKLSVTTPTAVKQNSLIGVSFHTSAGGASTSDVIFVCPDPVIEAA
jgi:phage tail protein X